MNETSNLQDNLNTTKPISLIGDSTLFLSYTGKVDRLVASCGVGFSKTTLIAHYVYLEVIRHGAKGKHLIVSTDYQIIRQELIPRLIQIWEDCYNLQENVHFDLNYSIPYKITFAHGPIVLFRTSSADPGNLRSLNVQSLAIDEIAECSDEVLRELERRKRGSDKKLTSLYVGVPQNRSDSLYWKICNQPGSYIYKYTVDNETFDRFKLIKEKIEDKYLTTLIMFGSTQENKSLGYSLNAYKNQIHGQFVTDKNESLYSFEQTRNCINGILLNPNIPTIYCSFDFNVTKVALLIGFLKHNKLIISNEITGQDTPDACRQLIKLFTKLKIHSNELIVTGDSSGQHRSSIDIYKNDFIVIDQLLKPRYPNYKLEIPTYNESVSLSVARLNSWLSPNLLTNDLEKLYISNTCEGLIHSLLNTKVDRSGTKILKRNDNTDVSHPSDALRYMLRIIDKEFSKQRFIGGI